MCTYVTLTPPLPSLPGFGHFRSPPLYRLAREAELQIGVVSTADSLDCSPTDLAILLAEGAVVKEMEAAAVAWVCQQLSIPFVALKSVTDIIDGGESTRDEFDRNLAAAALRLQEKLETVLNLLSGTTLASWCDVSYTTPTPNKQASQVERAGRARAAAEEAAAHRAGVGAESAVARLGRWLDSGMLGYAGWALAVALGFSMAWAQRGGGRALRLGSRAARR